MQKASQENRILALLRSRGQEWTPAPELAAISLQYGARLHSLRHERGIAIENRLEIKDGVKHGAYRLAQPSTPKVAATQVQRTLQPHPFPGSLFGDLSPEPEYPF